MHPSHTSRKSLPPALRYPNYPDWRRIQFFPGTLNAQRGVAVERGKRQSRSQRHCRPLTLCELLEASPA
jgi:hypothetical protein